MKLSVLRENFAEVLGVVIRAVDARPSTPVLANVLLEALEGGLRVTAQNLSVRISTSVGANVDVGGTITLPARRLSEVVNSFNGDRVSLELKKNCRVILRSGLAEFEIAGIDAVEYPPALQMEVEQYLSLPYATLETLYRRVAYAASNDINQETINALRVAVLPETITATALDGIRVGQATVEIKDGHEATYLIPARILEMVKATMSGEVQFAVGVVNKRRGDHIVFDDGSVTIFGSLTAGKFPNIAPLIPESHTTEARVDNATLLSCLRRANILAREVAHQVNLYFDTEGQKVWVNLKTSERGGFEESMLVELSGESMEVKVDVRYLIDALGAYADCPEVMFFGNGGNRHLIVSGEENSLAIITPVVK